MTVPTSKQEPRKTFGILSDVLLGVFFGGSLFFTVETIFVWLASWPEPSVSAIILQGFVGGFFSVVSFLIFGVALSFMLQDKKDLLAYILIAVGALAAAALPCRGSTSFGSRQEWFLLCWSS